MQIHSLHLQTFAEKNRVGCPIHMIVIIFNCRRKALTSGILNSQEINSDLNSKMLNFNMCFTSY